VGLKVQTISSILGLQMKKKGGTIFLIWLGEQNRTDEITTNDFILNKIS